jgi:2-polyprenyl-3-methyl-5-hydroxy-6-metoxy-1,4-benzoquinol methylase
MQTKETHTPEVPIWQILKPSRDMVGLNESHLYLLPAVMKLLNKYSRQKPKRVLEIGCGDGSVAQQLSRHGDDVTGVDPSIEGVSQARAAYPDLKLQRGSASDDLAGRYGTFPFVLSLEVVEFSNLVDRRSSARPITII